MKKELSKTLPNGMKVIFVEKPAAHHSYIQVSVPYGSTTRLEWQGKPVLSGMAHFIEHMMFQSNEEDISKFFVERQASINAYTTTTMTTYTVLATGDIHPLVDYLGQMLLQPRWTDADVAHERNIILQEQEMYEDDVYSVLTQMSLTGLFPGQAMAVDITGSKKDVAKMTLKQVEAVQAMMYQPEQLTWVITGPFQAEQLYRVMCEQSKTWLRPTRDGEVGYISSPEVVLDGKGATTTMPIQLPKFALGLKWQAQRTRGAAYIKAVLTRQLLTDVILSPLSQTYTRLYAEGIIDESFSSHFVYEDAYSYLLLMGTGDEKSVRALTASLTMSAIKNCFDPYVFDCAKRELIGTLVTMTDDYEAYSEWLVENQLKEADAAIFLTIIRQISLNDLTILAEELFGNPTPLLFMIKGQK
ncbi:M16 family metallopeptidase [Brochothrix campestris]|uniref:M16 family peptidase n=1 Tax=Brochothrix campestris FSL F6-1037 TaxID=1265861 RepID=W7CJ60_9LIST|nr:insulinase family protein [Brochothrix campestris]EUJ37012.1 M16 family peptidase [Brochothrix campestris FSL F6-1037]